MKNWKIILVLALIFVVGFVTLPAKNEVEILQQESTTLKEKKTALAAEFKTLQEDFQSATEEEKSLTHAISVGSNQAEFLADIEKITKKNGFLVDNISFSLGHNDEVGAEQINANFSLEGARTNIYNFLVDVENNINFMGLGSFGINSNDASSSSLNVSLYSFFQQK